MTRMRRWLFRGAAVALSLVAVLVVLELGARALGIPPRNELPGYANGLWMQQCRGLSHAAKRCTAEAIRQVPDRFRIFTFGGSSVAPDPEGLTRSFPAMLRERLNRHFPRRYQLVNLALPCKDSIYVRHCLDLALAAEPDWIVIYAGHNDFANHVTELPRLRIFTQWNPWLIALDQRLSALRAWAVPFWLGQQLGTQTPGPWRVLDDPAHGASIDVAMEEYARNLEAILERTGECGVPTTLVTVVSNLTEFPVRRDQWDRLDEYLASDAPDPGPLRRWREQFAEAVATARRDGVPAALPAFRRARDHLLRGRAHSRLNEHLRERARDFPHASLLDFEALLNAQRGDEALGCDFFGSDERSWGCDHVHPNERTHALLADELFRRLRSMEQRRRRWQAERARSGEPVPSRCRTG